MSIHDNQDLIEIARAIKKAIDRRRKDAQSTAFNAVYKDVISDEADWLAQDLADYIERFTEVRACEKCGHVDHPNYFKFNGTDHYCPDCLLKIWATEDSDEHDYNTRSL